MKNFFKLSLLLLTTLIATITFNPMKVHAASCNGSHTWKLIESYYAASTLFGHYECQVCGEERTVDMNNCTNHEAKTKPTYQDNGVFCDEVYSCKFCNKEVRVEHGNHNMKNNSYGVLTCTKCGKRDGSDTTTPTEDNLHKANGCGGEYIYTDKVPATCTKRGSGVVTCTNCSYRGTYEIKTTSHKYVSNGECAQEVCSVCGYANPKDTTTNHKFGAYVVKFPATCTADGQKARTCSVCNFEDTVTIKSTGHNFVETERKASTCMEQGSYFETCTKCGNGHRTYLEKAPHNYKLVSIEKEATCSSVGKGRYECQTTHCRSVSIREIPKTSHSYGTEKVTTKATCTSVGYKTKTCKVCKEVKQTVIPKVDHTYKTIASKTVKATCTKDGYKEYKCKNCTATKRTVLAATGHTRDSGKTTKKATCTENGLKTFSCKTCKEVMYSQNINKLGHKYKSKVTTKATCVKDGVTTHTCSNCKDTYTTAIAKTGHNYPTSPTKTVKATCTANGRYEYKCKNCSTVKKTTINATGHTSTYGGKSKVHTKCKTCGTTLSTAHSYTIDSGVQYKAKTCTTKQKNYKKCICGYNPKSSSYVIEVGTASHTPVNGGTASVHTKCKTCGVTLSKTHSYTVDSGVKYKDATCTEAQKNYKKCSCGYNPKSASYIVSSGKALGHSNKNVGTASVHTKCSRCGITTSTKHSYTVDSGVQYSAASCTSARKNYKKCSCGYNPKSSAYLISVGTESHTVVNGGTASVHTKCSKCGKTMSTSHSYTVNSGVKYKSATCTEAQKNYKKCSCGYNPKSSSYTVSTGKALDHSYMGSTVTKKATCSATGTRRYDCTRCTYSYTETIAKLAHSYTSKTTKSATCTSTGTKKYTCSKCSSSYTETIAKLGHNYKSTVTKSATCSSYGTKKHTCTRCSSWYTTTIAKTAHSYNIFGKCKNCGAKK